MKAANQPLLASLKIDQVQLHAICRKYHVRQLWLFGSAVTGGFREDSDIDLLYELDRDNIKDEEFLANFFGLYDSLKSLLHREVDLIKYQAIQNPYFLAELDATKVLLYDQSGEKVSV